MMMLEPIRILLVEDNPADAHLTRIRLGEAKVLNTMAHVEDGEQAQCYLRKQPPYEDAQAPDLILLDLNLPRLDGREVLAFVKGDPVLKRIPVVVLTSSEAEEDIFRSYELNANAFIRKPVDLDGFQVIANAIDTFWLGLVRFPPRSQG